MSLNNPGLIFILLFITFFAFVKLQKKFLSSSNNSHYLRNFLILSGITSLFVLGMGLFFRSQMVGGSSISAGKHRWWKIISDDTQATVLGNGRLQFNEKFHIHYSGHFEGFKRDLQLQQGQQIDNVQVGEGFENYIGGGSAEQGSSGVPGSYGTKREGDVFSTVWHHYTDDQDRWFWQTLDVQGVGERYDDADLLPLTIWGDQWPGGVDRLSARIVFPKGVPEGTQVEVSPHWIKNHVQIAQTVSQASSASSVIKVTTEGARGSQLVKVLVRLPQGYLGTGVKTMSGDAPHTNSGFGDQSHQAIVYNSLFMFLYFVGGFWLLVVLPSVALFLWMRKKYKDAEWKVDGTMYEPPTGPLAYGYSAAEEKLPPEDLIITATVLDLIARGFYDRENVRDSKTGDWRLRISLPANRTVQPGSAGEQALVGWLDGLLDKGPCILDDLQDRVENTSSARTAFAGMRDKLLDDAKPLEDAQQSHFSKATWISMGLCLVVVLVLALFAFGSTLWDEFDLFTAIAIPASLLGAWNLTIRSWPRGDFVYSGPQLSKVHAQWQAWRDWILHFDQMETAPDLQIILWERAFAGAVLWGVGAEFAQRVSVLVPDFDAQYSGFSSFSISSGASWGSSMTSTAMPSSGGGGGGGGFGGGGGSSW